MNQADSNKLAAILKKHGVVAGYLFGSAERGSLGPHSDIDVAVLFDDELTAETDLERRMKLATEIAEAFNVISADVIDLKTTIGPLIKYQAIFGGRLILDEDRERRLQVEREIVNDYEDSRNLRRIRSSVLRQELGSGTFGMKPIFA